MRKTKEEKAAAAREYRRKQKEKRQKERAALERAKAKLTPEEWDAVDNHFADLYYC